MIPVITGPDPTPEQLLRLARMYRRQGVWYLALSAAFLVLGTVELVQHENALFSLAIGALWLSIAAFQELRSRRYQQNLRKPE